MWCRWAYFIENHDELDFSMIYFNADGSESGFCGNGSRCITHLSNNLNIINDNAKFNAIDGIHESKITNGRISVKMNDVLKSEYLSIMINIAPHLSTLDLLI